MNKPFHEKFKFLARKYIIQNFIIKEGNYILELESMCTFQTFKTLTFVTTKAPKTSYIISKNNVVKIVLNLAKLNDNLSMERLKLSENVFTK
jgi:hypothetical protein